MIEDSKSKSTSKTKSFELQLYRIGNYNRVSARIGSGTLEEQNSKLEFSFELLKIEPLNGGKGLASGSVKRRSETRSRKL